MNTADLIAIDTHTHLEVSCWNPFDSYGEEYDRAADKYFRSSKRPTMAEALAFYREKKIGFVMFTVDAETQLGRRRIPNEEIAEAAQANSDIMIAFGSIDPHKGKMGAREARKLIEEHGVKGFKFHPTVQGFEPFDKVAWPIYEVIAEYKLPAIFHSGHSGIGSGMRCGGGLRLQNSNPMLLEDVAIAFPGDAQAQHLDRPVGLEPEVLSAAARAVRQYAAERPHPLRLRLPADQPRPLAQRLRRSWLQAGREAAHPERKREAAAQARLGRISKLRMRRAGFLAPP
jgi:hypothetical protein